MASLAIHINSTVRTGITDECRFKLRSCRAAPLVTSKCCFDRSKAQSVIAGSTRMNRGRQTIHVRAAVDKSKEVCLCVHLEFTLGDMLDSRSGQLIASCLLITHSVEIHVHVFPSSFCPEENHPDHINGLVADRSVNFEIPYQSVDSCRT